MTSIDMKATGEKIRKYMNLCGMTVREVAECLSLECVQSVYHWINGKSLPSVDNLYALARLLNVSMDDLIVGRNDHGHIYDVNSMKQRMLFYAEMIQCYS